MVEKAENEKLVKQILTGEGKRLYKDFTFQYTLSRFTLCVYLRVELKKVKCHYSYLVSFTFTVKGIPGLKYFGVSMISTR